MRQVKDKRILGRNKPDTKPVIDPEEQELEAHVKEVMGPAQHFDGSKPSDEDLSEMEAAGLISEHEGDTVKVHVRTEPKVQTEPALAAEPTETDTTEMQSAPEPVIPEQTDAEKLNKKLQSEVEEGIEELDIASLGESDVNETEKVAEEKRNELVAARSIPVNHVDPEPVVMKQNVWQRFQTAAFGWWGTPWKRYGLLFLLLLIIGLLLFVPHLRALSLNAVGYRSGLIIHTVDHTTAVPISGVTIKIGNTTGKTDENGMLRVKGLPLGDTQVTISKPAYATIKKPVEIGVRVADLGDVDLTLTGQRYVYEMKDYVTEKPIKGVSLQVGETTAVSNKEGKATLALIPPDDEPLSLMATAKGYRTETVVVPPSATNVVVIKLVPEVKEVYVSKQSGRYDVYKVDLDGKNSEVLLEGTGLETPQIALQMSPDGKQVAVVSTRDDKKSTEGYLLSALTIVDVASGDAKVVEHAEAISLVGWKASAIIFKETVAGASASNTSRQKIMLYDTDKDKRLQLAAANSIIGQWIGAEKLYYAASGSGADTTDGFMQIGFDGAGQEQLSSEDIWEVQQTGASEFKLKTATKWLLFKKGSDAVGETTPPAAALTTYVESPSGTQAAQLEKTGSVTTLRIIDAADKVTTVETGLSVHSVVRWASESSLVFRTVSGSDAAEYVVGASGGQPKKITDSFYGL